MNPRGLWPHQRVTRHRDSTQREDRWYNNCDLQWASDLKGGNTWLLLFRGLRNYSSEDKTSKWKEFLVEIKTTAMMATIKTLNLFLHLLSPKVKHVGSQNCKVFLNSQKFEWLSRLENLSRLDSSVIPDHGDLPKWVYLMLSDKVKLKEIWSFALVTDFPRQPRRSQAAARLRKSPREQQAMQRQRLCKCDRSC